MFFIGLVSMGSLSTVAAAALPGKTARANGACICHAFEVLPTYVKDAPLNLRPLVDLVWIGENVELELVELQPGGCPEWSDDSDSRGCSCGARSGGRPAGWLLVLLVAAGLRRGGVAAAGRGMC